MPRQAKDRPPTGQLVAWVKDQKSSGRSANTIAHRTRVLLRVEDFVGKPADAIEADDLVEYLAHFPDEVSPNTKATYKSALRAFYAWAIRKGLREDDPTDRLGKIKVAVREPRPVSNRELAAILRVHVRRKTKMMVYLAALQGLRCFEVARVKGEDVNFIEMTIRVKGKGNTDAVIALHPDVAALAKELEFPPRGWWFPSYKNGAITGPILGKSVSNTLAEVFHRAGVPGGAHRLRHWYATDLLKQGTDVRIVQVMMRHANLATTAIYTKIDPQQQTAAILRIHLPETGEAS